MTTAHEVLGVRPGASTSEIQAAYRRYAARHHPDHGGDPVAFVAGLDAYRRLVGRAAARAETDPKVVVTFHRRRSALRPLRRALTTTVGRITRRPLPPPRVQ
ncbi:MAG: J domain-containing protein [Actinomycetota bacterium]|nr:J domain-containing protein [Actinomycetota bacterium]